MSILKPKKPVDADHLTHAVEERAVEERSKILQSHTSDILYVAIIY